MTEVLSKPSLEVLAKHHPRKEFICGIPALDNYIHTYAGQDMRRNIAVPYVWFDAGSDSLVGYYTLSSKTILLHELPEDLLRALPRYNSLPGILIGWLAVDKRYQNSGCGEILLLDALKRCYELTETIGAWAVIVDAINEKAKSFYLRYGFCKFKHCNDKLFIPMSVIRELF